MEKKDPTPRSLRLHIGLYGKRNSGKSSLLNGICGYEASIVSDVPGTTADAVYRNIEMPGLGACVLVDTAGFDDKAETIGELRVKATQKTVDAADMAVMVVAADDTSDLSDETAWLEALKKKQVPTAVVISKADMAGTEENRRRIAEALAGYADGSVLEVSSENRTGIDALKKLIAGKLKDKAEIIDITGNLVGAGDTVVLVMPQDSQAPRGRLILPQVQTIRNLLDKGCTTVCCTEANFSETLDQLKEAPKLVITDSQVFKLVEEKCPKDSMLTSFSVLFARMKGDIGTFVEGAQKLAQLKAGSRVLIAEACTHTPQNEDIGRVKLPRLLRRFAGEDVQIEHATGNEFPEDLSRYDLIIHCGACMFNRRLVMSRVQKAREQGVAMTNYGIAIAFMNNILKRVVFPD